MHDAIAIVGIIRYVVALVNYLQLIEFNSQFKISCYFISITDQLIDDLQPCNKLANKQEATTWLN
jgi:hypothetical protein